MARKILFVDNFIYFREDEYLVNMQHTVIPSWYQREGYIKAMADLIQTELANFDCPEEVMMMVEIYMLHSFYFNTCSSWFVQVTDMIESETSKP